MNFLAMSWSELIRTGSCPNWIYEIDGTLGTSFYWCPGQPDGCAGSAMYIRLSTWDGQIQNYGFDDMVATTEAYAIWCECRQYD